MRPMSQEVSATLHTYSDTDNYKHIGLSMAATPPVASIKRGKFSGG